uniref:Probable E3 ubiquitin-protein ligase HERC6 n=1 Tax=Gouania willdenowi TaxID=441366 RepID=A0A8C5H7Q1_GOUWI
MGCSHFQDGRVFTFGSGSHGQLGHNSSANEVKPRLVDGLDGLASQIACGRHHTLIWSTHGQLWAFGNGSKGQIGVGSTQGSLSPALVKLPWITDGAAASPTDLKISAGWNANFIFSSPAQNSAHGQITGRLDESKIQKWLSASPADVEATKEIKEMFLTSSSLVTSFTKASGPPEPGALTVDLHCVCQTFDKMFKIPWIKQSVNLKELIELLFASRTSLKTPEIILILLSCPLLLEESNVINVVLPITILMDDLNEKMCEMLKSWWTSVPESILHNHIMVFKKALIFLLKNNLLMTHNPGVRFLLEALKFLYKANKVRKSFKVPLSTFYVEEVNSTVNPVQDFTLWKTFSQLEDNDDTPAIFCRYPFVFTLACKVGLFNISAYITKKVHKVVHELSLVNPTLDSAPIFQLTLRRTHLVEDTFRQLGAADHCAFQRELWVQFVDDRKLMDVNKRDLFLHVFEELMAPEHGMFMYNENQTVAWFPPRPKMEEKHYFLFGVLCGMALYNHNVVHLLFPRALFKKMLRIQPKLEDMKEFDPRLAETCRLILEDYSSDDLQTLEPTFTIIWGGEQVELDPTEPGKAVTEANRKEFVSAYIDHIFNKSVEKIFEAFKQGFFKVCDIDIVEFFQPEELQMVMVGDENYDWEMFKQNTVYEGEYHATHPNIITFWNVFQNLKEEEKRKFFLFLTGCARVPYLGMKSINMRVAVLPDATELHMPEALTCHFLLLLPLYGRYPVKKTMKARLLRAINHNRGFWK